MRFEGKHNFKKSVKNFKNIAKALVKKHQAQFRGWRGAEWNFDVLSVSTTSWVKSYGAEYQVGMYVITGVENQMPLFNRIDSTIVRDDDAYLLICKIYLFFLMII